MTHLSDREINGYIHHTLTDAQRETMDRHIIECPRCRTQVQDAERLRRQMSYDLAADLRRTRPSGHMRFNQIQKGLNRRRRWTNINFYTMQVVSTGSIALALFALVYVTFSLMGVTAANNPEAALNALDIPRLFSEEWLDPTPYQSSLITSEQTALEQLTTAPIYHLDINVSDDLQWINGRQQLRTVNNSGQPLHELIFHLYPNGTYADLSVSEVFVNGRNARFHLLDGERALYVELPRTLRAGQTAVVQMAFELSAGRTWQTAQAASQSYHQLLHLIQFHPTLAVYNPESGWDMTPPAHNISNNNTNNFYRVRIIAPARLTLLSSGSVTGRKLLGNGDKLQQVVTIAAGPVNNFYLTVSDRFQVAVEGVVGQTRITSYAHSARLLLSANESLAAAQAVLAEYNRLFGPYPYTELDIVNVPTLAFTQRGASYSGIILLEHDPYVYTNLSNEHSVLTQVGRQWFDTAVAPHQLTHPWLADGLAEYAARYYYAAAKGNTARQQLENSWQVRSHLSSAPLGLPAAAYGKLDYFNAMYSQTPLFLAAVAEAMGQEQFNNFLRHYIQTYKWGGGDTAAFQQLAEQHCDCDLEPVFTKWFITPDP
ncbi:MAG: M1 family metallopeptidase [Chloroflexi bacterium]|nr:M1 family metallopeptidase [Chloroflexota bacterium]